MDDFLQKLRSGQLKQQQERPKRPYRDQQYKSAQRRTYVDRRKIWIDYSQLINAVKDTLVAVNETLKSIAATHEALAKAEEKCPDNGIDRK